MQNNSSGFPAECSHVSCERRESCNLVSEAKIGPADTNEALQVEMYQTSNKPMKAEISLCFASIFFRTKQNFSGSGSCRHFIGFLANSWMTFHWHTCGFCAWTRLHWWENSLQKEQQEISFFNQCYFLSLLLKPNTEWKTFQTPYLTQLVHIEVIQNSYWLMPFQM